MDFGELFRIIQRRWRVSVPILLLTIIGTVGVYLRWPTTYQSTAEITLLGSASATAQPGSGNNPYLLVGGLGPMANILAADLSTEPAVQQLNALGVTYPLTAEVPPFAAGPFVTLTLQGKNTAVIIHSMPAVISFAESQLVALQENGSIHTPQDSLIRASVIAPPSTPTAIRKRKIELMAGVGIGGIVALFLFSFSAEARAIRRVKRRPIAIATPSPVRSDDTVEFPRNSALGADKQ